MWLTFCSQVTIFDIVRVWNPHDDGSSPLKLTHIDIMLRCQSTQDCQKQWAGVRRRDCFNAPSANSGALDSCARLGAEARSHSLSRWLPCTSLLDSGLRSTSRTPHPASLGVALPFKTRRRVSPIAAGRRPSRPAAGQPSGLSGAPVGAGAVALRQDSGRVNSVARRRTWPEPQLLKLALAGVSGLLFDVWVAHVGGDRRHSDPSVGCALPWGSLRQRTPRLALAYTPENVPDAGASGAGSRSELGLSAVQPGVIRVPSSGGVCSGRKGASFVGTGGCVRAVRARGARRPGTSRAFRGISRSCPGELARRRAVRAVAPGTHFLFHGALDRSPPRRSVQSPQTLVP